MRFRVEKVMDTATFAANLESLTKKIQVRFTNLVNLVLQANNLIYRLPVVPQS